MTKKAEIEFIRKQITTNKAWACKALMAIFARQTEDEKNSQETIHENGMGFTGNDANFLTAMAKSYLQYHNLTDKQMFYVYKKIGKYAGQIHKISNKEKLAKAMGIKQEIVKVTCYDKEDTFKSREEAIKHFKTGMLYCSPGSSEFARYATIVQKLECGETVVDDNYWN